jgi:hypothetical protein
MSSVSLIREKLQGMTALEVVSETLLRSGQKAKRAIAFAVDKPEKCFISDRVLENSLQGVTAAEVADNIRHRKGPHLTAGIGNLARTAELVKHLYPDSVEEAQHAADRIVGHQFAIFDRVFDLGPVIDWHADPATGLRWPFEHFTRVPIRLKPGSDVRVVWENNRLYHFTELGRAYALTGDEKYSEEFLLQMASWYEENPPRFGVNWTVAMEASIRAINIIAAMGMFRASPLMTDDAIQLLLKTLLAHGRFIRANIEFSYRTPGNHYLSCLIGLFAIGLIVPEFKEAGHWVRFSAPRLIEELNRQVLPDGVSYEGAIGYHRLVLEIYTLFFALAQSSDIELPGDCWERLEAMFTFVSHYLKIDGTAPLIGDSDDGRILKFRPRPAIDHSYLIPMAAVLLENESFKESTRIDEEALWWFGPDGHDAFEGLPVNESTPTSRGFQDSQVYVMREGPLYAIIDCGDHGLSGRGSHAHSDALSLEVYAFDRTFLRDPGTFVYTASDRWRNLFRSTAYHNTVRIDGVEISRISEGELFALGPNVKPQVLKWETSPETDLLDAEHRGYSTLAEAVTHRRIVFFDKLEGFWTIKDIFTGEGAHRLDFFFNFDEGLEVSLGEDNRAVATGDRSALAVVPLSKREFESRISTRWVSLNYGTRVRSSGIIYRFQVEAPFENVILLIPYRLGDESKVERVVTKIQDSEPGIQPQEPAPGPEPGSDQEVRPPVPDP